MSMKLGSKGGSTHINLFVMLFRPHTREFEPSELPKQMRVQAKLRSTTFVMPKKAKPSMHTLQGSRLDKDSSVKQEKTHTQNYTMALNRWETNESEGEGMSSHIHTSSFPHLLTNYFR